MIAGEWWNANVVDVETQALATGTQPNNSDAFTINGLPGDLYPCSQNTDQEVGSYYMAANAYVSDAGVPFNSTATRGIVVYEGAPTTASPIMPLMPAFNDTPTAHKFFTTITGLAGGPHWVPVPHQIDEHMFVTVNMGISACPTCLNGTRLSASMNNYSFVTPTSLSMLQAFYFNVSGIYTPDFPNTPPVKFDYTNDSINVLNSSLLITPKSTSVKVLKCALALGISYSFRRREWTDERVYFATTST
ncbi:hypothetical protein OIU76_010048 [Salix suchowensis]|nr:hypothetical protein OIU76_010048 [Salix suchowensis]